jgi:predicted transcriptional regulator
MKIKRKLMAGETRKFVSFGIRVDKRIAKRLDELAAEDDRKRNWFIEQILAEKCGIILNPDYEKNDNSRTGEIPE